MQRRVGLVVVQILCLAMFGWAQGMLDAVGPGAEVQIRIQLEYGGTLPAMAKVELLKGGMPFGADHSNLRGEVTFRGLARGSYTVRVDLEGFKPEEAPVEISTPSDTRFITIVLRPDPNATPADAGPSLDDPVISARMLAAPEKARKEVSKARESRLRGDCKKGLEQASKAAEIAPDFVLAHHEMGMCQISLDKLDDAKKSFETAIEKDPKYLYSYLTLARVLAKKKDLNGAASTLAAASKAQPDRGEPYYEMARLQFVTGDVLRAEKTAEMALQRDCSRITEMPFLIANIHLKKGDKAKAISSLEEFVAKSPNGPQAERAKAAIKNLKAPPREASAKK